MNILLISHFFPPHRGGVETASYNTMRNLAKLGHNVVVLTSKDRDIKCKVEEKNGSLIYRFKSYYPPEIKGLTQSSNLGIMPKAILKLPKIIKKHKIHLIHVEGRFFPISFISAFLNHFIFKKPILVTAQGRLRGGITKFVERIFDKTITRTVYQKTNKIICVSNSLKQYLLKENINERKLIVIPNGVDTDLFTRIKTSDILDKYIETKKDCRKVIFVGRLDKQKGVEYLLKAIPKIIKEYEKSHFFILGNGILEMKLKNLVEKLDIKSYVTFLDMVPLEKMPEYYSAAEIFCLPSIHEGFPLTISEALSIGLVIVASNTEGIPDAILEGEHGFLFEPGNVSQLAEKIVMALNLTSQEAKRISENNTKLAKEKYSWEIIVKKLLNVYKSCFKYS
ncbi:MAG: glycosyltransferase family 4 protein [Promethearchaeota archaeon]